MHYTWEQKGSMCIIYMEYINHTHWTFQVLYIANEKIILNFDAKGLIFGRKRKFKKKLKKIKKRVEKNLIRKLSGLVCD